MKWHHMKWKKWNDMKSWNDWINVLKWNEVKLSQMIWMTDWLTDWMTEWMIDRLTDWMNQWIIKWNACMNLYGYVFKHLFSQILQHVDGSKNHANLCSDMQQAPLGFFDPFGMTKVGGNSEINFPPGAAVSWTSCSSVEKNIPFVILLEHEGRVWKSMAWKSMEEYGTV